jgi:hypothetical protein
MPEGRVGATRSTIQTRSGATWFRWTRPASSVDLIGCITRTFLNMNRAAPRRAVAARSTIQTRGTAVWFRTLDDPSCLRSEVHASSDCAEDAVRRRALLDRNGAFWNADFTVGEDHCDGSGRLKYGRFALSRVEGPIPKPNDVS